MIQCWRGLSAGRLGTHEGQKRTTDKKSIPYILWVMEQHFLHLQKYGKDRPVVSGSDSDWNGLYANDAVSVDIYFQICN